VTPQELATWQARQVASIDTNGDGKLSAKEISDYELRLLKTWTMAQAKTMVRQLDTNGDGLLSASELLARPMTDVSFSQLDTNHDGVLSGSELQGPQILTGAQGSFGSYPQYGTASAGSNGTQNNGTSASGN
jgi:transcription elongation factor